MMTGRTSISQRGPGRPKAGWLVIAAVLQVAMLAAGCGDGRSDATLAELTAAPAVPQTAPAAAPQPGELERMLAEELARLGIDPARATSAAPTGKDNAVFDLRAEIADPDWPNGELPVSIELSWTERLSADYNQDGLVTANDLTPLGQFWQRDITYDDPALHDGFARWPSGDPDGAGAANWRAARVDGNGDGLVHLGDITTIAQHWDERLSGYRVYRRAPGEAAFTLTPNPDDGESPLTTPRSAAFPPGSVSPDPTRPVRYRFLLDGAAEGTYEFFVVSFDTRTGTSGPAGDSFELLVSRNAPPVVALTVEPQSGIPPLAVAFDASASSDPDGTITEYEWDFNGDGKYEVFSDEVATTTHTYEDRGLFNATVRATDDRGASVTAATEVRVNTLPIAALNASPEVGLTPLLVEFDASESSDPDGAITLFEWDWQNDGEFDEETGTAAVNARSFAVETEHTVTVRVTDTDGESATATTAIKVNQPPVAQANASRTEGASPLDVRFDHSASLDPDGSLALIEWDWEGDGLFDFDTTTTASVVHRYEQSGVFDARLRVTDDDGADGSTAIRIAVDPAPTAYIRLEPDEGLAPFWISLEAWGNDVYNEVVRFEWDFEGDGVYDLDSGPHGWANHEYAAGEYSPAVRVSNDKGMAGTASKPLTVSPDDGQPRWHAVQPVGLGNAGTVAMSVAEGRAAIAYTEGYSPSPLVYVRASDELGLYWSAPVMIDPLTDNNGRGNESIAMTVVDSKPTVCYRRMNSATDQLELVLCQATDSAGSLWQGPRVVATRDEYDCAWFSLAEVNGRPAISYTFWDIGTLYYRQATGTDGSSWAAEREVAVFTHEPWDPSLLVVDGRPAIAFDGGGLCFVRADDADGASWPVYIFLDSLGGGYPSLAIIDGHPAIAHYRWGDSVGPGRDLKYIRASDPQGTAWGPSVTLVDSGYDDDLGRYPSLAVIGGIPAIACDLHYASMYISALDATGASWDLPQPLPLFDYAGTDNPLAALSGGLPAVCYGPGPTYAVYF